MLVDSPYLPKTGTKKRKFLNEWISRVQDYHKYNCGWALERWSLVDLYESITGCSHAAAASAVGKILHQYRSSMSPMENKLWYPFHIYMPTEYPVQSTPTGDRIKTMEEKSVKLPREGTKARALLEWLKSQKDGAAFYAVVYFYENLKPFPIAASPLPSPNVISTVNRLLKKYAHCGKQAMWFFGPKPIKEEKTPVKKKTPVEKKCTYCNGTGQEMTEAQKKKIVVEREKRLVKLQCFIEKRLQALDSAKNKLGDIDHEINLLPINTNLITDEQIDALEMKFKRLVEDVEVVL
jgi:hypothetical protein